MTEHRKEKLTFGQKGLVYKQHKSVADLAASVSLDTSLCKLYRPLISISSGLTHETDKVSARKYLQLAGQSVSIDDEAEFLSSITNSKRAVHRRYDEILTDSLSLKPTNKFKFNILINDIGVYIPDLIKDFVIDPRNVFEHEFKMPGKKSAQGSYEVARLFLDSTELLVGNLIRSLELGVFETIVGDFKEMLKGLEVNFGKHTTKEGNRFLVNYYDEGATGDYVIIDMDHNNYKELVFLAIKFSRMGKQGSDPRRLLLSS